MPDVLVKDSSLTSIADAIRTSTKTAESLKFPEDFVEAISRLGIFPGGVTALSSGTYTPATNALSIEVNHGLGVTPNFLFVYRTDRPLGTYTYMAGITSFRGSRFQTDEGIGIFQTNIFISSDSNAFVEKIFAGGDWDEEVCSVSTSLDHRFTQGKTYSWIAGVIDNLFGEAN